MPKLDVAGAYLFVKYKPASLESFLYLAWNLWSTCFYSAENYEQTISLFLIKIVYFATVCAMGRYFVFGGLFLVFVNNSCFII